MLPTDKRALPAFGSSVLPVQAWHLTRCACAYHLISGTTLNKPLAPRRRRTFTFAFGSVPALLHHIEPCSPVWSLISEPETRASTDATSHKTATFRVRGNAPHVLIRRNFISHTPSSQVVVSLPSVSCHFFGRSPCNRTSKRPTRQTSAQKIASLKVTVWAFYSVICSLASSQFPSSPFASADRQLLFLLTPIQPFVDSGTSSRCIGTASRL